MTSIGRELRIGLVLTPLYLLVRGYEFGTRDHGIHLPYIERAADPEFLPGDPLLDIAVKHSSYFFDALALVSRVVPLETVYLAAHALSVLATILGVRALARGLWPGPRGEWAAAVAVAGAFVHRFVAGSIPNLDALFLPRVASLGPLLFALALGARGRWLTAFGLTGVVFSLHATTAAHTAFALWTAAAIGARVRAWLLGPAVFLAAASPLLLRMALEDAPDIPTPAPDDWLAAVKLHFPFHHFPHAGTIVAKIVPGVLAVALGVAASRWRGAGRILAGLLLGVLGLFAAGWVGNSLLRLPATIHLHLFEAGRILDYVAIVALGGWSFLALGRPRVVQAACAFTVAAYLLRDALHRAVGYAFIVDPYPLVLALVFALAARPKHFAGTERQPPAVPRRGYALIAALCALLLVASGRAPAWHPTGAGLPGHRLMVRAGSALPTDAVVIVPPYLEEPLCAFRHFARRRAIGTWKDGGEGAFDLTFALAWERQLRDITGVGDDIRVPPGAVAWRHYAAWLAEAHSSYHRMPAEHFVAVAARYGATHVVREAASERLSLPVVYEDDEYVLYEARPGHGGR